MIVVSNVTTFTHLLWKISHSQKILVICFLWFLEYTIICTSYSSNQWILPQNLPYLLHYLFLIYLYIESTLSDYGKYRVSWYIVLHDELEWSVTLQRQNRGYPKILLNKTLFSTDELPDFIYSQYHCLTRLIRKCLYNKHHAVTWFIKQIPQIS